jgi:hypothetical protein
MLSLVLASAGLLTFAKSVDSGMPGSLQHEIETNSTKIHQWKNRDRAILHPLKRVSNTSGALRKYESAFPMTKIDKVIELPGFVGKPRRMYAVTIIGVSNQLQIIDAEMEQPVHVLTVPESHDGGISALVWDRERQRILFSTLNQIYEWSSARPDRLEPNAIITEASTLYGALVDSKGNLWVGAYPTGAVYRINTAKKAVTSTGKLAPDTDYTRRLVIDERDQIWVGTGSLNPRIFVFSSKSPNSVEEIALPRPQANGFISTLDLLGDRLIVSVSGISEQLVLNVKTRQWEDPIDRVWGARLASEENKGSLGNVFYTVSDGALFETDTQTWNETKLGSVPSDSLIKITTQDQYVSLVNESPKGLVITRIDVRDMSVGSISPITLKGGDFKIQSLLGHSDGNIYLGGYMGEGLASVNPDTNARWSSPAEQTVINQIEGMVEFDPSSLYVGSYGFADIVSVDYKRRDISKGYLRLERLDRKYGQSRPFGWATNSNSVFFGTVPDYGRSGGVLGKISPYESEIDWVLDGDGKGYIEGHSIIGLVADEQHVYGTTSVRNGYGIPDTKGPAKIFKFDIKQQRLVWQSSPILDTGALYAPTIIAGWLLVADIEGINVIDPVDGRLVRKHRLSDTNNSQRRAGWASADLAVGGGGKIVHSAADTTTVIDFVKGTMSTIGSRKTKDKFGYRITSLPTGRVFGTFEDTTLVEFDLKPFKAG